MNRNPANAAMAALLLLAATSASAEIINVNITNLNPNFSANFGGLSFNVNTAATTNTFTTGTCGSTSGVYTTFSAAGGITDASLVWNGVDYSLQSSNLSLDSEGGCDYDFNMSLTFNNGTTFITQDQPLGGPFLASQLTPSQMLATSLIDSYNSQLVAPFLTVQGQPTGDTGLVATATSVPEPDTLALFAIGLAGVTIVSMRRAKV
jgi:hypothetical protein